MKSLFSFQDPQAPYGAQLGTLRWVIFLRFFLIASFPKNSLLLTVLYQIVLKTFA